jgi:plasmid stability protein
MPDVLVRDVESDVLEALKAQAARNGRSLQAEAHAILSEAARLKPLADRRMVAARIRRSLAGREHTDSGELLAAERRMR